MAGLESTGFVIKTFDEIKTDVEEKQRASLGDDLNQSASSLLGNLNAIVSQFLKEGWEVAQAVNAAFDPEQASGVALDVLCSLTGVQRLAATKSRVTLTATGTPTTVLGAGRIARIPGSTRFVTIAGGTITALTSWVNTTAYNVGDRRTNSSKCYVCITAGTSAGSGGPTTTASNITDGTVHWKYIGSGTGAVDLVADAENTGPLIGNAGTVTEIVTPQSGWTSINNLTDAEIGNDEESDSVLRLRRENSLRVTGAAGADAVRADVLDVEGVTECFVFQNVTDVVNSDGVPAGSIEVVVRGGVDADIRTAIWKSVAAGIYTYGSVSGTITDAAGNSQTVRFSRPTDRTIYVRIDVTKDALTFPADGSTQIKTSVAAWAQANLGIGDDVVQSQLYGPVFDISGVVDVTKLWISFSNPATTPNNLSITSRQIADIQTANITVNVS